MKFIVTFKRASGEKVTETVIGRSSMDVWFDIFDTRGVACSFVQPAAS